ncbi:predicted protein [Streptomyces viridochromogenes DSM 40736]|uniref:Predicted protein n=1 Tax=Streptomyces viridochromogenes (strain DSM 40736 / JCM 4977 / BCRC 1201 / Tue 494) TaxID=591159 RepID=D9X0B1_STRVT|nr:hypothetical protein [Streptomyces viridochromogenes]EFL35495.1 predicted protein [Streptomyces viridochromogenes DSM 40736]
MIAAAADSFTWVDLLKFLPGWLAFVITVGTLIRKWWTRRHVLALGPDDDELRAQLVQLRSWLEEVPSGTRADWFLGSERKEAARRLRDSAARRSDRKLRAALGRAASTWDEIFELAPPPPRMVFRAFGGTHESRERDPEKRKRDAMRDAADLDRFQKMATLAGKALTEVDAALDRLNELERKTIGRS